MEGKWGTQSAFLGCGVLFESLYAFLLRFKGFNQDINQLHSYRSILSPSANMPLFLLQFVSVSINLRLKFLDVHIAMP